MDYSDYLKTYTPDPEKLKKYGFRNQGEGYVLEKDLKEGDLFARFFISVKSVEVKVYDKAFDDEYLPFNVVGGGGAAKAEVESILEEIVAECFVLSDVKRIVISEIATRFNAEPENPFEDYPEAVAFYTPSRKWFAVFLRARKKALGLDGEGEIELVNIKADSDDIELLVDGERHFYAYHMNKKYWLSIAIDKFTDKDALLRLVEKSYKLAGGRK